MLELLVVISIVALLIALLLPALEKANDVAQRVQCASRLRQISVGTFTYAQDWDGAYPATGLWWSTRHGVVSPHHVSNAEGRSAMVGLMQRLQAPLGTLACPTAIGSWFNTPRVWERFLNEREEEVGLQQALTAQPLGYAKYAGSWDYHNGPTVAPGHNSRYVSPHVEISGINPFTGYMHRREHEGAAEVWRTESNGLGSQNIHSSGSGTGGMSPSEIAVWGDLNREWISEWTHMSHTGPLPAGLPNASDVNDYSWVNGVNEAMADGHVEWVSRHSGALYVVDGPQHDDTVLVQTEGAE